MADKIKLRRDSSSNWTNVNPVLDSGELGFETNTRKLKVGDGATQWTTLPYASVSSSDLANAVDGKADLATTLAGYGITDAYTKVEADALLDDKANSATTYSKTDVDTIAALKADKSTTYTKIEVDTSYALKADKLTTYTKTEVDNDILALEKADVGLSNVDNTSDASKPISTATQTALDLKLAQTIDNKVATLAVTASTYIDGTLTEMTYTGGYKTKYSYLDGNLTKTEYTDTDGTTILLTLTYGYDVDGNFTTITRS